MSQFNNLVHMLSNLFSVKYSVLYNDIIMSLIAFIVIIVVVFSSVFYYMYKRNKHNRNSNITNIFKDPPTVSDLFFYIPNVVVISIMIMFVVSWFHVPYASIILSVLRIINDMAPLGALWVSEYMIYRGHNFCKECNEPIHPNKIKKNRCLLFVVYLVTTILFMFGVQP